VEEVDSGEFETPIEVGWKVVTARKTLADPSP